MNEKLFGKIVIALMSLSLTCAVALPAVRNGTAFRLWVISLPIGIVAISGYLAFRKSRKRVTPLSVIGFLWFIFCMPLLFVITAVLADYSSRHSDAYRAAIEIATNSEICNRDLGPSWKVGWPIEGETQIEGSEGRSILRIPLAGTLQRGSLHMKATKTAGIWRIDALTLVLANGQIEQITKAENTPSPQLKKQDEGAASSSPSPQTVSEASEKQGIRAFLQPFSMLFVYALFSPFILVAAIFYILTLQRAMMKCAPESRDFDNSFLWRSLMPLIGLIFHVFVVLGIAKTFRKEFERRGISDVDPKSGRSLGIAMCLCGLGAFIPLVGLFVALAGMVLWIMYWSRIAKLSRKLNPSLVSAA